ASLFADLVNPFLAGGSWTSTTPTIFALRDDAIVFSTLRAVRAVLSRQPQTSITSRRSSRVTTMSGTFHERSEALIAGNVAKTARVGTNADKTNSADCGSLKGFPPARSLLTSPSALKAGTSAATNVS